MKSKKLEEALQYLKTSAEKTPFLLSSCGITYKELYDLLLDLQTFYDIANKDYFQNGSLKIIEETIHYCEKLLDNNVFPDGESRIECKRLYHRLIEFYNDNTENAEGFKQHI